MPVDERGNWITPPGHDEAASIEPQIVSATTTFPAFDTGDVQDLEAVLEAHAHLRTALSGANNDIDWIQLVPGTAHIDVAYVDPGAHNAALNVVASADHIVVNLATDGSGAIVTTANDIIAAILAGDGERYAKATLAPGNDGTGVVVAMAAAPVVDWAATTLDVKLQIDAVGDGSFYDSPEGAFAQVTAIAGSGADRAYTDLGEQAQWVATLGGATHIAAFSLSAQTRR